jgi:hypothetical protein
MDISSILREGGEWMDPKDLPPKVRSGRKNKLFSPGPPKNENSFMIYPR